MAYRSGAFGRALPARQAASIVRPPTPGLGAQQKSNNSLLRLRRDRASGRGIKGDKAMECDELAGPKDIPEDFDDDQQDEDEDDRQEDLDFADK
jgi:hypothetical protein